ncbi:MAG: divergent PAP2 family protein [Candidatus Saccharibacteria bacterium]|nr:divergent PAP2 family protein [Candidatus Saccharibacteria bacterium]
MISPYLIAATCGWVAAQGGKYIVEVVRGRSVQKLRSIYVSGGMPSAHSATVVALAAIVGLRDGIDSAVFAVAAVFAAVVMYDAMMVRRSSGKQGEVLKQLITEVKSPIQTPRFAKGHEPVEVLVGAILGVIIGCVVFFATK